MHFIDDLLDRITMYRVVLYYLIALLISAVLGSILGFISYSPQSIILSSIFIVGVSYLTNRLFSFIFEAPTNVESVYITSLILACIVAPYTTFSDLGVLFWAGVLGVASKYILAINKKHLFNPAAIAVLILYFAIGHGANWWIGNAFMTPFIIIGGLLILRKTRREYMAVSFYVSSLLIIIFFALMGGTPLLRTFDQVFFHTSFFFFAYVMLTEPLTSPPTRNLQMLFGFFVGMLFPPQVHILGLYFTPELALVTGNVLSYFISPKQRLLLRLQEDIKIAPDIIDFIFKPKIPLRYSAGQYLEWTFPHPKTDSRGNRRYFTLSSSPTEDTLRIGVKFYENGSSYKRNLAIMDKSMPIVAAQLAGDFTLPKDKNKKLVFVAGGIGITPFRSMLKFLSDTGEKRDIVTLFSNKYVEDIVYKDVLDEAEQKLGIRTIYTLTDVDKIPQGWTGEKGRITSDIIIRQIPDWHDRIFYLSGPHMMVTGFEKTLFDMGVTRSSIKKDFFPGFV
jgi:ferredoxin-NADP reductase/Na+-translocating ferredoxin:NAD+ oxidoreductase RnfD subunit